MRVVGGVLVLLFSFVAIPDVVKAWTVSHNSARRSSVIFAVVSAKSRKLSSSIRLSATASHVNDNDDRMEPSKMRVSEIKNELQQRRVDFTDCFDKESLVAKLVRARDGLEPTLPSDDDGNGDDRDAAPTPPPVADTTPSSPTADTSSNRVDTSNTAEISTMRLSEIKTELKNRRINFRDCFDKEGLVDRLVQARAGLVQPMPEPVEPTPSWAGSSEHFDYGAESSATPGQDDHEDNMDAAFAAAGWTGQADEPSVHDQQRSPGMKRNFSKIDNRDFKKPYNFDK